MNERGDGDVPVRRESTSISDFTEDINQQGNDTSRALAFSSTRGIIIIRVSATGRFENKEAKEFSRETIAAGYRAKGEARDGGGDRVKVYNSIKGGEGLSMGCREGLAIITQSREEGVFSLGVGGEREVEETARDRAIEAVSGRVDITLRANCSVREVGSIRGNRDSRHEAISALKCTHPGKEITATCFTVNVSIVVVIKQPAAVFSSLHVRKRGKGGVAPASEVSMASSSQDRIRFRLDVERRINAFTELAVTQVEFTQEGITARAVLFAISSITLTGPFAHISKHGTHAEARVTVLMARE